MKRIAALAWTIPVLMAQGERTPQLTVSAVRHWSVSGATRVAIEVSGEFKYRSDRLSNPDRIYFDIPNSRPRLDGRRFLSEPVEDKFLQRVRVAETNPGVTRVVLELGPNVEVSISQLSNPNRLMVELRAFGTPALPTDAAPVPVSVPKLPNPPPSIRSEPPTPAPPKPAPVIKAEATPPPVTAEPSKAQEAPAAQSRPESIVPDSHTSEPPKTVAEKPAAPSLPRLPEPKPSDAPKPADNAKTAGDKTPLSAPGAELGKAAHRTSSGDTSLVRALGLKIGRVVIDPGHGGHDQGTEGPHGLLEKELVLDVSMRLGKLIEDRMGAEVIFTRTDDTFIPLEGRTALANDKKADLFLSIHANSSPVPRITGVETYYLSLTNSKEANDVAMRENTTAQESIFELRDLLQKIALNDKVEESKEFASRVQAALFAFSARSFPAEKDRGVKKAPFVVLIGANMPSILAEIGFVSNPREEALLKKSDYRQKLAEALFRGVSRYADSLSHFQVAQNSNSK